MHAHHSLPFAGNTSSAQPILPGFFPGGRPSHIDQTAHLPRGEVVHQAGETCRPLMLISGGLRLDPAQGSDGPVLLALPGTLIGLEGLQGRPALSSARAIVSSVLAPVPSLDDSAWRELLLRGLVTQQERAAELAGLRSGSAPERLRRLLLLLSVDSRGGAGLSPWRSATPSCEMPTLADMSALTDATEETISRVISAMRRKGDLVRDHGRRVRLDPRLLDDDWSLSAAATYAYRVGRDGPGVRLSA
jgi:CRP-like cAMP-binding protein